MAEMVSVMAKARSGVARGERGDPVTQAQRAMKRRFNGSLDSIETEVATELKQALGLALRGSHHG
jgi:hypothetical protein